MFAAYPGDIVLSKIDARNGAIGLLPPEINKAVVTAEFPVFSLDTSRLDGDFLKLVLRTGRFLDALRLRASGTTGRKRITPVAFKDLCIPLPPLVRQRSVVASFLKKLQHAASLEANASAVEARAAEAFESAVGLAAAIRLPEQPILIAWFQDIDRWSHEGILRSSQRITDSEPRFSTVPLRSLAEIKYGLQKSPANRPGSHARPYLRVANVQRWRLALDEIKSINVPDIDMPKYRLEKGDLLLCEGNSADLVGRGAIWDDEIADCVHQNHIIRIRLDPKRALPEFVLSVINSGYGQAYFRSRAKRTTNLASINSKEVAAFPLPLPSITEQREMTDAMMVSRGKALKHLEEARQVRTSAWSAFEAAVYRTKVRMK